MSRWTHAICARCYDRRYPGRRPVTMRNAPQSQCCDCGLSTSDGIYCRIDPATVAFPREPRESREEDW